MNEQRLQSILHAYLQAVDRGERPDRQALLNAHPDLRDELAAYFADASKVEALAKSLQTATFGSGSSVASPLLGMVRYLGDYELLEEIARGAMGVVFKARQVSLNRVVALKMILKGELATEADVRRFRQEAEAAAGLDHPNIVPIYEVGEHEGQQYFSMKFIETTPFSGEPQATATMLAKVARAVHHAHQRGILHRDLKPSNILIDQNGEPHVADFGLAKMVKGGEDATKSGAIVGTPAYMAPEQARAEKSLTTAVDVYSLGAILYEGLTGRPPFRGDDPLSTLMKVISDEPVNPRSINGRVDRDLETICLKCLEKEPTNRYESAAALADDLERWLRREPIHARPATLPERAVKWARRKPAAAGLIAISIVGLLLLLGGLVWNAEQQRDRAETERGLRVQAEKAKRTAEKASGEKETALSHAESLRLAAQSNVALATNPSLALLLALEGSQRARPRSSVHNNALVAAMNHCRELRTLRVPGLAAFDQVCVSPNGKYLAAVSSGVQLWDLATGTPVARLALPGGPFSTAFSPDGKTIAVITGLHEHAAHVALVKYEGKEEALFTGLAIRLFDTSTGKELHVLKGHQHDVAFAHFSPDGKRLVSGSWDGSARIWNVAAGTFEWELPGRKFFPNQATSASFNASGTRVLTTYGRWSRTYDTSGLVGPLSSQNKTRWENRDPPLPLGKKIVELRTFPDRIAQVSIGRSADDDYTPARLWDAEGKEIAKLLPPKDGPKLEDTTCAVFSADGKQVVTGHCRGSVNLWDAENGKHLRHISGRRGEIKRLFVSADGKRAFLWYLDDRVISVDLAVEEELAHSEFAEAIAAARLSSDGRYFLIVPTWSPSNRDVPKVLIYDAGSGKELARLLGHEDEITDAEFQADGVRIATSSRDGSVRLWQTVPREYGSKLDGVEEVPSVRYSPDGKHIFSASTTAALHDATGKRLVQLSRHPGLSDDYRQNLLRPIRTGVFSPDSTLLATIANDKLAAVAKNAKKKLDSSMPFLPVQVWDVASGKERFSLNGLTYAVRSLSFSPDGNYLLTVSDRRVDLYVYSDKINDFFTMTSGVIAAPAVQLWNAKTGQRERVVVDQTLECRDAIWSPDGRLLTLVVPREGRVDWQFQIIDPHTGKPFTTLDEKAGIPVAFQFSPDGRLVCGHGHGSETELVIWDARTGQHKLTLKHPAKVQSVAWGPDGKTLVTAAERSALIWDVDAGVELFRLSGHTGSITSVAWCPATHRVATAAEDGTARVWDAKTGKEWITLTGHRGPVVMAEFSVDGQELLTASSDGTVRLWRLDPLVLASQRRPRDWTDQERAFYEIRR